MDTRLVTVRVLNLALKTNLLGEDFYGIRNILDSVERKINSESYSGVTTADSVNQALMGLSRNLLELTGSHKQDIDNLKNSILMSCMVEPGFGDLVIDLVMGNNEDDDSMRKSIHVTLKEIKLDLLQLDGERVLAGSLKALKTGTSSEIGEILSNAQGEMESISDKVAVGDPAITDSVSIADEKGMEALFDKAKELNTGEGVLALEWDWMNDFLLGGLRRGHLNGVVALQHNYKSGLVRNMFRQVCMNNTPLVKEGKTPLAIYFSFEDPLINTAQFLYQDIMFTETGKPHDINDVSSAELNVKLAESMGSRGFHVEFLKINPSEWGYRELFNKIIWFESQGYEVVLVATDYLGKLNLKGCDNSGAQGTQLRDLFRRVHNFASHKDICWITPHQAAPKVRDMIDASLPQHAVAGAILEHALYSGSRQISQELDCEIAIHKITRGDGDVWLNVTRGKHRLPMILPGSKRNKYIKFNNVGMPISGASQALSKLPSDYETAGGEDSDGGLNF